MKDQSGKEYLTAVSYAVLCVLLFIPKFIKTHKKHQYFIYFIMADLHTFHY